MAPVQSPAITVGRTVLFWQAGDQLHVPCAPGKPLCAKVCEVLDSGNKVNLAVFDRRGNHWPVEGVRFYERTPVGLSDTMHATFLPRLGE